MREFLVAYLEYGQPTRLAKKNRKHRVFARRLERVDSATKIIVADMTYDSKNTGRTSSSKS